MLVRKWPKIIFALWCIAFLAGCAPLANLPSINTPTPSPTTPIHGNTIISFNTTNAKDKTVVDNNLIGFSLELPQVCEILSLDAQNPAHYEQLYKNLGNGVLHLGGH